ncbi:hypothetical protein [Acetobacterium woodii]|uniref:Uncharacterized protein n=1 Tax=Acetobacterium woodii (strain ATCC 29683 / DSM 1030 / JCM 2381 / KCTC 1655 / WB1) TaxID=931626 RepID=H6LBN9_ACEWD|nr:hypothetical protein [Acetobacterium woodii]AFA50162.1 hypothetical protein Awo_c34360 [Acetobacterium woodii DSM 1030]
MSKENTVVELSDVELVNVSGGVTGSSEVTKKDYICPNCFWHFSEDINTGFTGICPKCQYDCNSPGQKHPEPGQQDRLQLEQLAQVFLD